MNECVRYRTSEATVVSVLIFILAFAWIATGLALDTILGVTTGTIFPIFEIIGLIIALVGIGLLMTSSLAHTVALIMSGISLLLFPLGTIIGIVCLWLLTKPEVKKSFCKY